MRGNTNISQLGCSQEPRRFRDAELVLSRLELDVAQLFRAGFGRSAAAAALGISSNTVKTLFRRIRFKLGEGWPSDTSIHWPRPKPRLAPGLPQQPQVADPTRGDRKDLLTAVTGGTRYVEYVPPVDSEESNRRRQARRLSFGLLIVQSRPSQSVLRVSAVQRFWLRPALVALMDRRHIRLLGVDWHDVFDPPWLPLLNRGRRQVRGADYLTDNPGLVQGWLADFLAHGLEAYLADLASSVQVARGAARTRSRPGDLPTLADLAGLAREAFGW